SIEFHDFCGITPLNEVRQTLARLHRLGFFSVRMSRIGHQDTWLVNRRLIDIRLSELLFIRYVTRNWNELKRVMRRLSHNEALYPMALLAASNVEERLDANRLRDQCDREFLSSDFDNVWGGVAQRRGWFVWQEI